MDYNINFKYKSGGGTASSGMGAIAGMRSKAIQASTKQGATGTLRPDDSAKKLIDTNIKLSTNILKLNQSVTMLTATIKNRGLGGGGGGGMGAGAGGGNSGLGSVGAALGYIGVPVALAGFAVQKINQIGNAYIEKVSQQKGSVGVGGFHTGRQGAYLGPEVASAYKAHRMSSGRFAGDVDPMAFKMGTIFGQSAEEVGAQSGAISRYGLSYGNIASTGAAAGIETELPKFMQAISGELEDAVKNGVNASNMSSDIGQEMAGLVSNSANKNVEMAMGIVSKTRASKESAAKGQISGMESLMTWKAGQSKLMEKFGSEDRESFVSNLEKQGLISSDEAKKLRTGDIGQGGAVSEQFIRQTVGQGGYSALVRDTVTGMGGAESARLSMKEVQKTWGTGVQSFRQWNAMYPGMGGELGQNELLTLWKTASDPKKFDKVVGKQKLEKKFKETEGEVPLLGLKKTEMMDNLLYEHGLSFANTTLKMEKALIKMADTLADTAIPALEKAFGKKKYTPAEKKRLLDEYENRWE
jgi:hypothetical protein